MFIVGDFSGVPSIVLYASTVIIGLVFTSVDATRCLIGQEPDGPANGLRWALPYEDPSLCTDVEVGGVNVIQPQRPFYVSHCDAPMLTLETMDIPKHVCLNEIALGMEDGRIPDNKISASSFWDSATDRSHAPEKARLNTKVYASAWCAAGDDFNSPWIQVEFTSPVTITGLITQGRWSGDTPHKQWVTSYTVAYGEDMVAWSPVNEADGTGPKEFAGNTDTDSLVNTTRFDQALDARFLRILPTGHHEHVSMRFEVVSCSEATVTPSK